MLRDKREFRGRLVERLASAAAKTPESATTRDWYLALAMTLRDELAVGWIETKQRHYSEDVKRVYYLSLEFLIGRSLLNALNNLGLMESCVAALNDLGRDNGIGRIDLVENRFVGMKSRGIYETPGGTILLAAHRAMESLTLDRGAAHLKDELMPRYAELIYNGFWFSPEREMLQALIDKSQERVSGTVRLKLYKGNVITIGRESANSLYSPDLVTFEDDQGAYDQKDAEGFIKLNALRLRTLEMRNRRG